MIIIDINYYLGIYALAWIIELILYLKLSKSFGFGGFILTSYVVSAITSVIYYNAMSLLFYETGEGITTAPLLFLFICINVCIFPYLRHSQDLSNAHICDVSAYKDLFYIFTLVFSPFIIESFIELFLISFHTDADSLGTIYASDVDVVAKQLSALGILCMIPVRTFSYIWPIIFFVLLNKGGKYRKMSLIPFLAIGCNILEAYSGASRAMVLKNVLIFIIAFLIFKQSMDETTRRKIIRISLISFPLFVIFLILITISRYDSGSQTYTVFEWLTLYTGEAPIRFCQNLWDIQKFSYGDTCFPLIKNVLGFDTFTDYIERESFYESRIGVPMNIFYTFIGDLYTDFGLWGTLSCCILFSICSEYYLQKIKLSSSITIIDALIFIIVLSTLILGITYMTYKVYTSQLFIFYGFITLIIMNLNKIKLLQYH